MSLSKPNPIEPPWYETRMPGGVGGVAPRGVPLSRSNIFMGDSAKLASAMSIASRRPVFGLKGMSGRREAGLVFFPNPEASGESPCPTV
jgi:hypothetical protein